MDAATMMDEQSANKSYASELYVCSLRYDLDERPYEKTTDIGSVNLVAGLGRGLASTRTWIKFIRKMGYRGRRG